MTQHHEVLFLLTLQQYYGAYILKKLLTGDRFEAGISVNISVQSITTRAFKYISSKDRGIVSKTICFEGQVGMHLKQQRKKSLDNIKLLISL